MKLSERAMILQTADGGVRVFIDGDELPVQIRYADARWDGHHRQWMLLLDILLAEDVEFREE